MVVTFKFLRSTKRTNVYEEEVPEGETLKIGAIYIQMSAMPKVESLEVTVEATS